MQVQVRDTVWLNNLPDATAFIVTERINQFMVFVVPADSPETRPQAIDESQVVRRESGPGNTSLFR